MASTDVLIPNDSLSVDVEDQDIQTLKDAIQKQIEFYFSQENLAKDAFLISQMNSQMSAPLSVVAEFTRIKQLTTDYQLIIDAIRQSPKLLLNENSTMIQPNIQLKQRNTIILREIPSNTSLDEIKSIFKDIDCDITDVRSDVGDTWFVTFENEKQAVDALTQLGSQVFNGSLLKARLKSETMLKSFVPTPMTVETHQNPMGFLMPQFMSPQFGIPQPMMNGYFPFSYLPTNYYPQVDRRNNRRYRNYYNSSDNQNYQNKYDNREYQRKGGRFHRGGYYSQNANQSDNSPTTTTRKYEKTTTADESKSYANNRFPRQKFLKRNQEESRNKEKLNYDNFPSLSEAPSVKQEKVRRNVKQPSIEQEINATKNVIDVNHQEDVNSDRIGHENNHSASSIEKQNGKLKLNNNQINYQKVNQIEKQNGQSNDSLYATQTSDGQEQFTEKQKNEQVNEVNKELNGVPIGGYAAALLRGGLTPNQEKPKPMVIETKETQVRKPASQRLKNSKFKPFNKATESSGNQDGIHNNNSKEDGDDEEGWIKVDNNKKAKNLKKKDKQLAQNKIDSISNGLKKEKRQLTKQNTTTLESDEKSSSDVTPKNLNCSEGEISNEDKLPVT